MWIFFGGERCEKITKTGPTMRKNMQEVLKMSVFLVCMYKSKSVVQSGQNVRFVTGISRNSDKEMVFVTLPSQNS